MDSGKVSYFFLALILTTTFFAEMGVSVRPFATTDGSDLISATCNHTQYFDICVSSMQSDPKSRVSDLQGLAAISLGVGINHAKETIAFLKQLRDNKSRTVKDTFALQCLGDCMKQYNDALDNLHESASALGQRSYDTVNVMVSGAMTEADTCESGFGEKPGVQSPVTDRNEFFFKLCSNSLAITNLLA